MNTLNYKGYIGSIEISEADNCLYGQVLGLPKDTLISYEGETVKELKEDFQGAVDDYLILQYYSNNIQGINNPSFFIEKQAVSPVYEFCEKSYEYLKSQSTPVEV